MPKTAETPVTPAMKAAMPTVKIDGSAYEIADADELTNKLVNAPIRRHIGGVPLRYENAMRTLGDIDRLLAVARNKAGNPENFKKSSSITRSINKAWPSLQACVEDLPDLEAARRINAVGKPGSTPARLSPGWGEAAHRPVRRIMGIQRDDAHV